MGSDAYYGGPGVLSGSTQRIQSGQVQFTTDASGNGGAAVVFPIAYTTAPMVALGWTTGSGSAVGYVQLSAPAGLTTFTARVQNGNGSTQYTIFWIAVGT